MEIFTPNDAMKQREQLIPDYVFQAFNELLSEKYDSYVINITQDEIVTRILRLTSDELLTRHDIFRNKWLDVEDYYIQNGWSVEYDKPGHNENYKAFFRFMPKNK